eukprot:gene1754-3385_t
MSNSKQSNNHQRKPSHSLLQHVKFFWEKSSRIKCKSRFNLLLLEYGEYFFEDLSAYWYPVPNDVCGRPFKLCDSLKVQGRLKLCSRSIIFEPNDPRKAIIKFPFKTLLSEPDLYRLAVEEMKDCSIAHSGFFTFYCSSVYELKANDKIGPYQQVDYSNRDEGPQVLFALVHTEPVKWLEKLGNIRRIYVLAEKEGWSVAEAHLAPMITAPSSDFDISLLVDFHETPLLESTVPVQRVRPLELNPGGLMVTDARVYFQPAQLSGLGEGTQLHVLDISRVCRLYCRRHMLRPTALEILLLDGESALFCFQSKEARDKIYNILTTQTKKCDAPTVPTTEDMLRRWQRREISSFEYLLFLNFEAGRSLSDLAQYPVFPHVIADYKSETLNLESDETFRDLSRPIGALTPARLDHFKQRYTNMIAAATPSSPPPFLYGTHYSTPGYVLFFLARVAPEHMLCLQGGKFDSPDRMFSSMAGCWESCLNNPADLKELIPEFFCGDGEFLLNASDLELGRLHQGVGARLGDVELPPWSHRNPKEFIQLQRLALESEYVSKNLHLWIDLIFGYKQLGKAALQADNLFYHLTYEAAVEDLQRESDPTQRLALEAQVQEFGQTPTQLFSGAHPARDDLTAPPLQLAPKFPFRSNPSQPSVVLPLHQKSGGRSAPSTPDSSGRHPTSSANESTLPHNSPGLIGNGSGSLLSSLARSVSSGKSSGLFQSVAEHTAALFDRSLFGGSSSSRSSTVPPPTEIMTPGRKTQMVPPAPRPPTTASTVGDRSAAGSSGLPVARDMPLPLPLNASSAPSPESKGRGSQKASANDIKTTNELTGQCIPLPLRRSGSLQLTLPSPIRVVALSGGQGHRGLLLLSCCCAGDGILRVWQLDLAARTGSRDLNYSWDVDDANDKVTLRHSLVVSETTPLSMCCITGDGTLVLVAGGSENIVHSYSVPRGSSLGQHAVHEDSISAMHMDDSGSWLLTGSTDSSVRLWALQPGGSLSPAPLMELFDLEHAVSAVALLAEPRSGSVRKRCRCVAAGEQDGHVSIWTVIDGDHGNVNATDTMTGQLIERVRVSPTKGAASITALCWLPVVHATTTTASSDSLQATDDSIQHCYLLCGTQDGTLLLMDVEVPRFPSQLSYSPGTMRRLTNLSLLSPVKSIAILRIDDEPVACVGCQDGSLRGWVIKDGDRNASSIIAVTRASWTFSELFYEKNVHRGGVNSLSSRGMGLLVSGGEDGVIHVWRVGKQASYDGNDNSNLRVNSSFRK